MIRLSIQDACRSSVRLCGVSAAMVLLCGCAVNPMEIGREPSLSPVGTGVMEPVLEIPTKPEFLPANYQSNSFWSDSAAGLFKDPRARRIGDVLTVKIAIEDRASLDNSSSRSRDAKHDLGVNFDHDVSWRGWQSSGTGALSSGIKANTQHEGKGETVRSERIEFLVAAIVTDVLPNGKLIINGSQEVRVNYELRVISVSGVLDPRDISSDNMISYERIAEARISYGGRGRSMEVQQPGWGQQIIDIVSPF